MTANTSATSASCQKYAMGDHTEIGTDVQAVRRISRARTPAAGLPASPAHHVDPLEQRQRNDAAVASFPPDPVVDEDDRRRRMRVQRRRGRRRTTAGSRPRRRARGCARANLAWTISTADGSISARARARLDASASMIVKRAEGSSSRRIRYERGNSPPPTMATRSTGGHAGTRRRNARACVRRTKRCSTRRTQHHPLEAVEAESLHPAERRRPAAGVAPPAHEAAAAGSSERRGARDARRDSRH